jgi:tetratricopeptide (TPR) repeat protein
LVQHLERLKALGLVFRYETDGQVVYSAHPFLRDFFRNLLGTKEASVHESVRARLAPSLEARPKTPPKDPAILDQYELLIEETLLAGRVQEAFDLYWYGLGTHDNLGWVLGESIRGLRILERFVPRDDHALIETHLPPLERGKLVNDLGLFAGNLGDLSRAHLAFLHARRLAKSESDPTEQSICAQNLANTELFAGRFPTALAYSQSAVSLAKEANETRETKDSLILRGLARFALGDIASAAADFPRTDARGFQQAECRLLRGDRSGALSQTQADRQWAVRYDYNVTLCPCDALLARLLLPDDPAQAARHLQDARAFANRSGGVELQLRCFHGSCELHRHLGDYPQAIAEGEAGILLAETCGFGKFSIDLHLALAETLLAAGDARKALQNARNALDRSEHPDCQYAWGKADGLHFCGLAHLRLGERELARQRLTAAHELRERLGHGRLDETRRALALCRP